jgi:hypothetical protein
MLVMLIFAGAQANADRVVFRFTGGEWSHSRHAGWHRYWGGPSIGFYYAPTPVYIVSGYDAPSYYSGPDFWYSNPSFGLSLNFGGGGYDRGGYSDDRYSGRDRYYTHDRYDGGDRYRSYPRDGGYDRGGSSRYSGGDRYSGGSSRYSGGGGRNSNSSHSQGGSAGHDGFRGERGR